MIVQRMKRQEKDSFSIAKKYYSLLFDVNNINVTEREIQLISFMAINGSISYKHVKEEFCKEFKTTNATINNMVSRLKNVGVLVKDGSKVKVHPSISLDFNKDVTLQITLLHEAT
jgi:hypothetical protein